MLKSIVGATGTESSKDRSGVAVLTGTESSKDRAFGSAI